MPDTAAAGAPGAPPPTVAASPAPIVPFWRRLPFFFGFPLRPGPLIFLACIVVAAALAALVLGAFGLLFKGMLVYLGLRYGFNVLELFAKGRFEGESPDYTLWGPEKRPAKLGLVVVLFIVLGATLGQFLVDARITRDPVVQAGILQRHQQQQAADRAQLERDMQALDRRIGVPTAPPGSTDAEPDTEGDEPADASTAQRPPVSSADANTDASADAGDAASRAEILEQYKPTPSDALWFRLLPWWYWLVMGVASLMLPAATIVIALEDAFFRALNPAQALFFMQRMGSAYFVLWVFFLLIAGARHAVLTAGADWPPALRFPLELGLATYLGLVLCALLGYALYQYHREINMDVEVDFDAHRRAGGAVAIARAGNTHAALRQAEPKDPFERRLQALLAQGQIDEAISVVKDEMRYARLDPALNTRLHQLYLQQGDTTKVLEHGQQWLAALAQAGQGHEALSALRKLQAMAADYRPEDAAAVLACATAASKQGNHALAVRLLQAFDRRFPGHPEIPAAFFLGARLMSEYARQHDKAAKILHAVLARYPDHALANEVKTYLTVLEKTVAKPT